MSKHLLRTAMVMGITALALSFAGAVRAADEAAPAAPKAQKPRPRQFTGIVESIDAKAGTAIVKKDTESKTFKINDKTKYGTLEKPKDAAVTDIKVGDKVTVFYTEEGGVLTAVKIVPPKSAVKKEKEKEAPKD
jgi:Cu/Ag efflux protein CusF